MISKVWLYIARGNMSQLEKPRKNLVFLRGGEDGRLVALMAHSTNKESARSEFDGPEDEILKVVKVPNALNEKEQEVWDTLTRLLSYTFSSLDEENPFNVLQKVLNIVAEESRAIGRQEERNVHAVVEE